MKTILLALFLGVAFAGFLSDSNTIVVEAEMGEGDDQFGFYSPGAYKYSGTSLSNNDPIALFAVEGTDSVVKSNVSTNDIASQVFGIGSEYLCIICCNASEKCCDAFCN